MRKRGERQRVLAVMSSEVETSRGTVVGIAAGFLDSAPLRSE